MGLPLAMLLAAIMTMGNLGENYELLAMKSAGMSLRTDHQAADHSGEPRLRRQFLHRQQPRAVRQQEAVQHRSTTSASRNRPSNSRTGSSSTASTNMSIRVSQQDPDTHLLHDVLIYDNRAANGNMNTIVADSGYIRLSDDKKYLLVTLFHGETYEQTRNSQWFTQKRPAPPHLRPAGTGDPHGGFRHGTHRRRPVLEQPDQEHQRAAARHRLAGDQGQRRHDDAPTNRCSKSRFSPATTPCCRCPTACSIDKRGLPRHAGARTRSSRLPMRDTERVWDQARTLAKNSRNMFAFDESTAKEALNQLYRIEGRVAQENVASGVDPDLLPDRRAAGRHHPQAAAWDCRWWCR